MFENKIVFNFAAVLTIFGFSDVQAMSRIHTNTETFFDVRQPLSQWPIVNPLSTQKELNWYQYTWNAEKTLAENKLTLVNLFLDTCCDFSFKKKPTELKGVTLGSLQSGEDIVFAKQNMNISICPNSTDVLIYNERESFKGLTANVTTNIFFNITPLDFTASMKKKFEQCVTELAEDSVGCEVLRIAISKYKGGIKELPKITFIPVENDNINLAYTTDSNVWRYLKKASKVSLNEYKKLSNGSKFIMFSPKWTRDQYTGLLLRMHPTNPSSEFSINTGIIPNDVIFLHQLIYALNFGEDNALRETQLIEKRTCFKYFHGNVQKLGNCLISGNQINFSLFIDDKVYRTMYGFTKTGLDLINESSYFAHKYNFIRPMYLGIDAELSINGARLSKKESRDFWNTYLKTNGDFDLFRYYLSPKSTIEYPEFGIGKYPCSDLQ